MQDFAVSIADTSEFQVLAPKIFEPRHEKNLFSPYGNSKGADQPAIRVV